MSRRRSAAVLVATGLTVVSAACGGDGDDPASAPSSTTTTTTVAEQVTTREVTFVDPSRGTDAVPARDLPAHDDRTLETLLVQPAVGGGPFPLVVLAHGLEARGSDLEERARALAEAGYLVALPTFPLSSRPTAEASDLVNQPADISFVIDSVLELAADPADPLADLIDTERIAVAGHSLGGLTVLGAAYNSCCRDERVDAVIAAAAVEVPFPDGTYDGRPATPLLVVHGGRDDVIPFDEGAAVFAAALPPAYFLQLPTADHDSMLVRQNPRYDEDLADITDRTLIAFLDRYLREDADALDGLQASIEATGLATFEERLAG